MSLADLRLKFCYDSGPDDLANDFYIPCLSQAVLYDRAVGFFSSSIFEINWQGLRKFLGNNGRIRIICSQHLQEKDAARLALSDSEVIKIVEAHIIQEIDKMMSDNARLAALHVFGYLLASDRLKLKIAIPDSSLNSKSQAIFHSKVGIFKDKENNVLAFKGSSNESKGAFSKDGNAETIDVYSSWINTSEKRRTEKEIQNFELTWSNRFPDLTVLDFPEASRLKLIRLSSERVFEQALSQLELSSLPTETLTATPTAKYSTLIEFRQHQTSALKEWRENDRHGLMEHATGSGKTITGISAVIESLNNDVPVIVLVPSSLLLAQWVSEIKKHILPPPPILICGDGHSEWKNGLLRDWISERSNARVVVATIATASSEEFLKQLDGLSDWTLIADEVHRLGSTKASNFLSTNPIARLGLSATPVRAGDTEGTRRIFSYFGKILPTTFGLRDAIRAGILTKYHYSVKTVELTEEEMQRWLQLSKRLAMLRNGADGSDAESRSSAEKILIERFRIIKGAANKLKTAAALLRERYKNGERWIVYCDSVSQIEALYAELVSSGITISKYYSGMNGDSVSTLRFFEKVGGIILSVRCLDEGVDIPAASHALLIASSQNPREFIQRRGRILRKSEGKTISYICDLITLPSADFELTEVKSGMRFVLSELSRAVLFARDSINPNAAADIERIANRYELDLNSNAEDGIEADSEEPLNE